MIITYHNIEFFKLQLGDTVIAINPISKDSKFKGSRFGADIVLVTANSSDFNGIEVVSSKSKEPLVVNSPGEYEVQGVFIKGFFSETQYKEKKRINTIYTLNFDGMNIGFLGALESKDLDDKTKLELVDMDILFVPIGGEGVLNASDARSLANKLGAKTVIPMHYGEVGEKDALKKFLKEGGSEDTKPLDKLTIKKKDIEDEVGNIIVLDPVVS